MADRRPARPDIEVHDLRLAGGRLEQPEQDLDQRALAGPVCADETDDPGLELDRQAIERHDTRRVALGQAGRRNDGHLSMVPGPDWAPRVLERRRGPSGAPVRRAA